MKKRILIFGTGSTGERCFNTLQNNADCDVIAFLDNDPLKKGRKFKGKEILGNSDCLQNIEYDEIVVASLSGYRVIFEQLVNSGVPHGRINTSMVETMVQARINFLRYYSDTFREYVEEDTRTLACAEGGVYQGEFAQLINRFFPYCRLYLFDTFEGFSEADLKNEEVSKEFLQERHQSNTCVELVLSKMSEKANVIIKKGFFPDTTKDMPNEKYVFVNLDFDLYNPTLAGLRYFYNKMVKGGVILVHDYYNTGYPGVKRAISDFCVEEGGLSFLPIGDECSIAIMK